MPIKNRPIRMQSFLSIENDKLVVSEGAGLVEVCKNPTDAEITALIGKYNIDKHNVDSALDPDENGRLEFEPDHVVIILKRPRNYCSKDNFFFKVTSIGVFLFANKMLIVMRDDISIFDGKTAFPMKTLNDILFRLIYSTISHFMGHLKAINQISEELEDKINYSYENKYLLNMFTLEKSLVYFLNSITFNAAVFDKLKYNATKIGFTPDNVELLDDIIIENSQCLTLTQTYSNILSSLMDARVSLISNNLNVMMKNLNAIVIAVAIPSFFAGVGGMSEFSGMTGSANWKISYFLFICAMLVIGIITFYVIRYFERYWK